MRSPLAVVLGQCELLTLGVHGELTAKQREAVLAIQKHAQRALAMVDEVAEHLGNDAAK